MHQSQHGKSDGHPATSAASRLPFQAPEASPDGFPAWPPQPRNPELDRLVHGVTTMLLQSLSLGVIVVDGGSRVLFADTLARQMLLRGDVITQSCGQLHPARHASGRTWLDLILRVSEGSAGDAQLLRLTGVTGKPLLLWLRAVVEPSGNPTGMVLLLASDHDLRADLVPHNLGSLYELTRSECRLLGALLRGQNLKGYAAATGIACNTVRCQLKAILQKTGVESQAELVSEILGNPLLQLVMADAAASPADPLG